MSEMNPYDVQVRDVYLYTFRNNKLVMHYGELITTNYYKYGRFKKKKPSGEYIPGKNWQTSEREGEWYNMTVWFSEENLEKAKEIFIEYESDLIQRYQTYIKKCREKIQIIRGCDSELIKAEE